MQTLFIVMLAHRSSHSSRLSVGSLCVAGMPSSAAESDRAPGGGREGGREGAGHLIHKPVLISEHVYCTVMEHSTYTAFVPGAKIFPQEEGMGGGTKS